jgi:transcriptional regulator with XRE-family HTH domain
MHESRETLRHDLTDFEYRHSYDEDFLNTSIAVQIKTLRDERDLTQQQLAEKVGTKQAGISRLENVNYSAWKMETLRKLARAFDVRLRVRFESFRTLLDDAQNFSEENLLVPEFDQDTSLAEVQPAFDLNVAQISGGVWGTPVNTTVAGWINAGDLRPSNYIRFAGNTPSIALTNYLDLNISHSHTIEITPRMSNVTEENRLVA